MFHITYRPYSLNFDLIMHNARHICVCDFKSGTPLNLFGRMLYREFFPYLSFASRETDDSSTHASLMHTWENKRHWKSKLWYSFHLLFSFHLLTIKHGSWYVYHLGRNDRSSAEIDMTTIILVTVATAVAGSVLGGYILDSRFHIRNDFHQLRVALGSALK